MIKSLLFKLLLSFLNTPSNNTMVCDGGINPSNNRTKLACVTTDTETGNIIAVTYEIIPAPKK